jgi:hypothetical protein
MSNVYSIGTRLVSFGLGAATINDRHERGDSENGRSRHSGSRSSRIRDEREDPSALGEAGGLGR